VDQKTSWEFDDLSVFFCSKIRSRIIACVYFQNQQLERGCFLCLLASLKNRGLHRCVSLGVSKLKTTHCDVFLVSRCFQNPSQDEYRYVSISNKNTTGLDETTSCACVRNQTGKSGCLCLLAPSNLIYATLWVSLGVSKPTEGVQRVLCLP
jgi:hypothetical protein